MVMAGTAGRNVIGAVYVSRVADEQVILEPGPDQRAVRTALWRDGLRVSTGEDFLVANT
jgi:hypothetical protein